MGFIGDPSMGDVSKGIKTPYFKPYPFKIPKKLKKSRQLGQTITPPSSTKSVFCCGGVFLGFCF
jgi:hypothetical protein